MCENLDPIAPGARPELWRTDCIDFGKLVILDDDIDDILEYQENEHFFLSRRAAREWTCTDVRKVPSDCGVDDDPIGPVKEKSRDIADFNVFNQDQEYNPFRIWKIQVQKKKIG